MTGRTPRVIAFVIVVVAAACARGDEPVAGGRTLSHWKKEARQVSLIGFLNSDRDERRRAAHRHLAEIGEPAVPALLELFADDNISISSDAFNTLARLGPRARAAVPSLIDQLDHEKPSRRREAVGLLGWIGSPAEPAVPRLMRMMSADPDPRVRDAAGRALAGIGGTGHASLDEARASTDPRLRVIAMQGAATRQLDLPARRAAAAAALGDSSVDVRVAAVRMLRDVAVTEIDSLTELLIAALNDRDTRVRDAANGLLTYFAQRQLATPRLYAAVLARTVGPSRVEAAWRLGTRRLGDDADVRGALVTALDDSIAIVRVYAARALASVDGPVRERVLRVVRRDVATGDPLTRVRAAQTLWNVARDTTAVRAAYEAGLVAADHWDRVHTISAIGEMGDAAQVFVPHLERLRNDPASEVRDRAAKMLYWLQGRARRR
jgi:HEAT repeat protein